MIELPSAKDELARNYFRLVKLTMIEGTKAIRNTVLRQLPGGQTLHMILRVREDKIRSLHKGPRSVINSQQLAILYPENGCCNLSAIDMTLWCVLARNLLSFPRGVSINWKDDDHPPSPGEEEWYHNVVRIRLTRNKLFHLQRPELNDETFWDLWNYVSRALLHLDASVDFESYLSAEFDRSAARELEIQVKEQVLQEMNDVLRAELGGRSRFNRILVAVGVLLLGFLIATISTIVVSCSQESPCEKGVRYQTVGGSGAIHLVPRSAWGALQPSGPYKYMDLPVSSVFYGHTAEVAECSVTQDCCSQVKNIQILHMHPNNIIFSGVDIAYHYLIDRNGYVYEGRPPNTVPGSRHRSNYTYTSIVLIGNFMYAEPTIPALAAFDLLLEYLEDSLKIVKKNFQLYALCEYFPTKSPGINLYRKIKVLDAQQYPHIKHHVTYRNGSKCFVRNTIERQVSEQAQPHVYA